MLHYTPYKRQQGIALLSVLLFMQIIVMLGFYALESSLMIKKMSQLDWQEIRIRSDIETILRQIESDSMTQMPNCLIPVISSDTLMKKPMDWWQTTTCTGNFYLLQYYYVLEFLGEDSCALINQSAPNLFQNEIAAYYRITLRVMIKNRHAPVWMQSTLVKAMDSTKQCNERPHGVRIGLQVRREI